MTLYFVEGLGSGCQMMEATSVNIKEVEKITGISSQNIRFYEKYELVQPVRNANNGYREYNA